ncbi:unnamed protein product, partial [Ectocarpus sp. 13 AM-2016]
VYFTAGWGVFLCVTNRSYGVTVDGAIGSAIGSTEVSARKQATHFAVRSEMVEKRLWSTIYSTNRMVRSASAQEVHKTASSHGAIRWSWWCPVRMLPWSRELRCWTGASVAPRTKPSLATVCSSSRSRRIVGRPAWSGTTTAECVGETSAMQPRCCRYRSGTTMVLSATPPTGPWMLT